MATKAVSPGAALLRNSRLFSLPAQLPPAPGDVAATGRHSSATATQPFPTLQAVSSPRASRARGDWGFKRPLPPQAAAASDPAVRVRHVDTSEHVTDFASATDHVMTLRKWQALRVPVTSQTDAEQRQHLAGKSVFEEAVDVLAIDPAHRHTAADKRWKFAGPWLAGITEGAFQAYLKKQVRTRRPEFREFLRAQLAADRNAAAAAAALDAAGGLDDSAGIGGPAADASSSSSSSSTSSSSSSAPPPPPRAAADITDAELTEYMRVLRHDRPLLYRLVGKFLDLAPVEPSDRIFQSLARTASSAAAGFLPSASSSPAPISSLSSLSSLSSSLSARSGLGGGGGGGNPWAQDGPPITHPSAGLSYLRTTAYLDNHPLYGPQKAHPPVQARVVAPRSNNGSWTAKLGVAGFVVDSPFGESAFSNTRQTGGAGSSSSSILGHARTPGLHIIDPSVPGGAKLPVRVAAAKVNSQGRVVLTVADPDPEAVLVQRELEGRESIHGQPARLLSARADSLPRRSAAGAASRFALGAGAAAARDPVISSPQSYGLGQ